MLFALLLSAGLNEAFYLNITDKTLLDQVIVTDLEFNTSALFSDTNTYRGEEIESILGYVDKNTVICAAWPKIKRKIAEIKAVQTNWLKHLLTVALQSFGFPFLGPHNIESIRAFMIIPRPEFKLGKLYEAGSKMKQKSLELYQNRVEEARLDCLALEIVKQKKEAVACQL